MTYAEALNYIHSVSWEFCKPGLERIRELTERLGSPEKKLRFVHVAGTNGKGSFCSMLSSILSESGLKVGLYTSPYILRFNERMKINGYDIPDDTLAQLTEEVKPIADQMTDKPTEFELITAIAFLYFAREKADVVVLECGMGGRLDSTNIIEAPLLSVITGISLDHTAFLGDTVEKIAHEKAGIIKHGSPVLFGGKSESAKNIIEKKAKENCSSLFTPDHGKLNITSSELSGTVLDYKAYRNIQIPLLGQYQPFNTALVLEACEILKPIFPSITDSTIKSGLKKVRWPARFEILTNKPLVIFDGAHNPEGIKSAVESVKAYLGSEKVIVMSGVLKDKDYDFISAQLAEIADTVYTLTPNSPRALSAEAYADCITQHGVKAIAGATVSDTLPLAVQTATDKDKPLICLGSLYTYADVVNVLRDLNIK